MTIPSKWIDINSEAFGTKGFAAELSDFNEYKPTCPTCGEAVAMFGCPINRPAAAKYAMLFARRDREGEVYEWAGACGCGTKLTVFND